MANNIKKVAEEYLHALDNGNDFFHLFADDAEVFFPRLGLTKGRPAYEKLFQDLGEQVETFKHHHESINWVQNGKFIVAEGSSEGKLKTGVSWTDSKWCDVFEFVEGKIQRLYIYLDPDYARY